MLQPVALDSTLLLITDSGERPAIRFLEFFASLVWNLHMGRAYPRATGNFPDLCAGASVASITAVQPRHVATWIKW